MIEFLDFFFFLLSLYIFCFSYFLFLLFLLSFILWCFCSGILSFISFLSIFLFYPESWIFPEFSFILFALSPCFLLLLLAFFLFLSSFLLFSSFVFTSRPSFLLDIRLCVLVAVALRNQKIKMSSGVGQITKVANSVSIPALSQLTICFEVERTSLKQVWINATDYFRSFWFD